MRSHVLASHFPQSVRTLPRPVRLDASPSVPADLPPVSDRFFLAMIGSYRASGGLARAAEVVARVERDLGRDADLLTRWRAERSVVCFDWQALTWLPRFQFASKGLLPKPAVRAVLAELRAVFDEPEVAQWFATPNVALAGRVPADLIGEQPLGVVRAAQRDRFIVEG